MPDDDAAMAARPEQKAHFTDWAKKTGRLFRAIAYVIGGVTAVLLALVALWNAVPDRSHKPDCKLYATLTPSEQEQCDLSR